MVYVDLPKRIYQARPSVILSLDNEYLTFRMMDDITSKRFNTYIRLLTTIQSFIRIVLMQDQDDIFMVALFVISGNGQRSMLTSCIIVCP